MKILRPLILVIILMLGQINLFSSQLFRIPITLRENVRIELADISEVYQIIDSTSLDRIEPTECKYIVRYTSDNKLIILSQPHDPRPDLTNAVSIDNTPVRLLIYRDIKDDNICLTMSKDSISIDSIRNKTLLYSIAERAESDKIIRESGEAINFINGRILPVIDLQSESADSIIEPYKLRRLRVLDIAFLWDYYIVVCIDEDTLKTYHIRTHHTFTPPSERLMAFIQGIDEPSIAGELGNGNWQKIKVGETYSFLLSDRIIADYGAIIFIKTTTADFEKVFRLNNINACSHGTIYEAANIRGLYVSNDSSISLERHYARAQYAVIQNENLGTNINSLNSNWSNSEKGSMFLAKQYLYILCWEVSQKIGLKTGYHIIMNVEL